MSSRCSTGAAITPFPLPPDGPGEHADQSQARSPTQREPRASAIHPRGICSPVRPARQSQGQSQTQTEIQAQTQTQTQTQPRPSSEPSPDLSRSSSARGARLSSSILPALRLAGLAPDPDRDRDRAREMRSSRSRDPPSKSKAILTLKLSGSSFLDTIIRDDRSKDPLYILETSNEVTSIVRLDHPRDVPVKAATVQWPLHPVRAKGKSGRTIQIGGGSWREAEDLLKAGPLGNTACVPSSRSPALALRLTAR